MERLKSPQVRTALFIVLACLGALASRYAVPFAFRYSMSFLPLAVAVLLFLLYRAQLTSVLKASRSRLRLTITCALTALLFSFFLVIGSWSVCEDSGGLGFGHILAIVVNALPLYVLVVMLMMWLDGSPRVATPPSSRPVSPFHLSLKGYFAIYGILILCWLPVFLAAFPGFFACDMSNSDTAEYIQYVTGEFSDDYPFAHVMLLGTITSLGESLTGSFNGGVVLFIVLQMLGVGAIMAYVVHTIANCTRSRLWTVLTVIYLGLDPLISMYVVCTTRDTPFSAFAVLLALLLFVYFRKHMKDAESNGSSGIPLLISIALCAIAFCLFRPNGIIAFIILVPFLILCERGLLGRVRMGGICAGILVVCWLWFVPIAGALGVQSSPNARLLVFSLPTQQISKVIDDQAYTLTEIRTLTEAGYGTTDENGDTVVTEHAPELADVARENFRAMATDDIISAYVAMGLQHPGEYFEAFVEQTQAAWNPYAYGKVFEGAVYEGSETSLFEFNWEKPASSQSLAPGILEVLKSIARTLDGQNIPLFSLLLSLPLYLWILILCLARAIITLDRRIVPSCALFVGITLTVFFGPCVLVRYYLPLIFGLPVMLLCLGNSRLPQDARTVRNLDPSTPYPHP